MKTKKNKPLLDDSAVENILKKDVANIVTRVRDGKPLTAAQRALMVQYSTGSEITPEPYVPSQVRLAQVLGLARPTVSRLSKLPDAPKLISNGSYDVAAWLLFLRKRGIKSSMEGRGTQESDYPDRDRLEADKLRIQCRLLELQLREAEGSVIERAIYENDLASLTSIYADSLNDLHENLAAKITDEGVLRIVALAVEDIRKQVMDRLDQLKTEQTEDKSAKAEIQSSISATADENRTTTAA